MILSEAHVQPPMQLILHGPVTADIEARLLGGKFFQAGDVAPAFYGDFAGGVAEILSLFLHLRQVGHLLLVPAAFKTATQRLAVDGDEPSCGRRRQRTRPCDKAALKGLGRKAGKEP